MNMKHCHRTKKSKKNILPSVVLQPNLSVLYDDEDKRTGMNHMGSGCQISSLPSAILTEVVAEFVQPLHVFRVHGGLLGRQ
jgi:hypothetical protein